MGTTPSFYGRNDGVIVIGGTRARYGRIFGNMHGEIDEQFPIFLEEIEETLT